MLLEVSHVLCPFNPVVIQFPKKLEGARGPQDKKDFIKYSINEIGNGSTLILGTKDKELINAIHQFMEFQRTEHKGH